VQAAKEVTQPVLPIEGFVGAKPDKPEQKDGQAAAAANHDNATRVAFKGVELPGGKAGRALDLTYMLTPRHIPCALDTAIDSTIAGPISCHIAQDQRSPMGVLLMRTGTQVTGSYKNDIKTGQARLFSMAATAITPEGIPVPLDTPMSDGFGRAGTAGDVDHHYFERFGTGILLSIGEGALGIAQAALSKGNNTYLSLNSGGGVGDIAAEILHSQINIPPTITVAPGTIVMITTLYPIDFSDALRIGIRR
jgi:type IV secretion system protein VirB10